MCIHCLFLLLLFVGFCVESVICFAVLCSLSSFAIITLGERDRELVALSFFCVLNVMSLLCLFV